MGLLCGLSGDRLSFATFFKKRGVTVSSRKAVCREADTLGSQRSVCRLFALWLWASDLVTLTLSFFTYKINITLFTLVRGRIK